MMKHLIEIEDRDGGVLDHAFIAEHTTGIDGLLADLRAESWPLLEEESGLPEAQIRAAAEVYRNAQRVIACWGMGITQHMHSVATIQMIVNWLLLRGNISRPGAGRAPCAATATCRATAPWASGKSPGRAAGQAAGGVRLRAPARARRRYRGSHPGHAGRQGARVLRPGGNFAAATPDTYETWKALRRCDLTVHVTTKLNRSHIVHGREALILPCLGRTEIDMQAGGPQGVTVEDSMSMVHLSMGINPPASDQLLSEPAIVARLAAATIGARSRTPWLWLIEDYARIRDKIEAVFADFKDFNQRVAVPGGFRLRNTASERVWATAGRKASFVAHPVPVDTPSHQARALRRDTVVFTLLTTRSHDQYNTTIYGHDDRYRGVFGQRRVVFIHEEDIRSLGLKDGDCVDIQTVWSDGQERRADRFKLVAYDIPAATSLPTTPRPIRSCPCRRWR